MTTIPLPAVVEVREGRLDQTHGSIPPPNGPERGPVPMPSAAEFSSETSRGTRNPLAGLCLVAALALPAANADETLPWNLPSLFEPPVTHATDARPAKGLESFFYEGAEFKGKPSWVFAYYGVPKGDPPAGGWPAVVCAHGGGGTAFPEWVRKWNNAGYAAIAMDLEGHLPGGNAHQVEGGFPPTQGHQNAHPARVDYFGDRVLPAPEQWFYHAVADVIRADSLLRSRPEINKDKIGLTGISWGATVACTAAGL
ncbi:MAG: acetylxylan esterase, partial [Planctomycetes bacterium]|nr:acetylxylan esterase [Planctomycetota bacterium]